MSDVDDLLTRLRTAGGDTTDIEVKSAAGGLSSSVTSTLCALANLPGGGWLILGLDEAAGFTPVTLPDVAALKQGVAGKARSCLPPVQLQIDDATVDATPVVIVRVAECPVSEKPCREAGSGQAWVRAWDGDYTMSALEEQAFLRQREHPNVDRVPVAGATGEDLDPDLCALWAETAAALDPQGLGKFADRGERMFRGGVVTSDGTPTKAGLLALGVHPQQFFPRYVVNLAVIGESGARARDPRTVSGPVPAMLDGALDWARKVFTNDVVAGADGRVRDAWSYPLEAFRELIGNALVHRDLDMWSEGEAVEVRLSPQKLVITSPGGLYGITVDRLGQDGTTVARNPLLLEVCRYTRSSDDSRVVETLASGIPRVFKTLREGGHPDPLFFDTGLRFTAVLRPAARTESPARHGSTDGAAGQEPALRTESEREVWRALKVDQELTAAQLVEATGKKLATVRKALRTMIENGLVERRGGQGQRTSYRRAGGGGKTPIS